eukprot:maker-scaffold1844_size26589-snap-gene-0.4 protein:Tk08014 transcript:maker-scaffold1844_size26589-snap-gene-0.4-mRNA-1 annotation:"hypothetical protein Y032_1114g3627"
MEQGAPKTKLMAYFELNTRGNAARDILYPGITKYFTWNQNDKAWRRRKRGHVDADDGNFTSGTLGRIPTISLSPKQSELYYLRMLLHNVAGAQSYEDLRTVDAELCPTFQAACNKLGLLEDDNEKDMIMGEAALLKFGPQLRDVFATILMFHRPADPKQFWEKWRLELCRDFMKRDRLSAPSEMIVNQVLFDLQDRVERDGLHLANDFQMPMPNPDIIAQLQTPRIIREEIEFDVVELQIRAEQGYATLNMEQKNVFDRIYNAVTNEDGQLFALNASGGTGKTHTINLLLSRLRSEGKIAIATALSGIAATLLENGRTLHSRCKVPLDIKEHSTCNMSKRDASGKLFQRAKLLIIDEVSMGHRFIFEAIIITLQVICNNTEPFGGLSVVFVGDWKQILPVIPRGGRPQIVQACLKKSSLWSKVTTLTLSVNMRVSMGSADNNFAEYIMSVGNGLERIYTDIGLYKIRIPSQFLLASNTLAELCHFVFDHLESHYTDEKWLCSRAVIAPTNAGVLEVNNIMMEEFPGEARVYRSADTVDREGNTYPTEFLNKLNPPGFPPHSLVPVTAVDDIKVALAHFLQQF